MKSRGVYETPGGTVLLAARRAMESITLDRGEAHLKVAAGCCGGVLRRGRGAGGPPGPSPARGGGGAGRAFPAAPPRRRARGASASHASYRPGSSPTT
jgi:hypothetical protein